MKMKSSTLGIAHDQVEPLHLEVYHNPENGFRGLICHQSFGKGEVISAFSAQQELTKPNYLTVQISAQKHIILHPNKLECVNHSCKPNCFFNIETMTLEAVEDIEPGTELFFFYPSTEWDMEQSFQCHCGEDNCIGTIMGAKYLPLSILKQYNLSPYIQNCLAEGI
jgi:hypothetical protein